MQRRAAAAYLVLFLVIGVGAYAVIGVAEKPHVDLEAPEYAPGDTLTVDGRTYTVDEITESGSGGGGHGGGGGTEITGTLTWTDSEATSTASLENGTTVAWQSVSWDGQDVQRRTLSAGETIQYNGSSHEVELNTSASPPAMTVQQIADPAVNETVAVGDTLSMEYEDELILGATLTSVTDEEATLTWGEDYQVVIQDTPDPDTARLIQSFNLTRRLAADPFVFNETSEVDGVEGVVYRTNDTFQRLDQYLPDPEIQKLTEGDSLTFEGNETTVGNITSAAVPLEWTGPRTYEIELSQGGSANLNGQPHFVRFPDNESVQILPNGSDSQYWQAYQADQTRIHSYNERMAGLWGVTILSLLAAIILAVAAYIPVKD